jgi:hypothetical protein
MRSLLKNAVELDANGNTAFRVYAAAQSSRISARCGVMSLLPAPAYLRTCCAERRPVRMATGYASSSLYTAG